MAVEKSYNEQALLQLLAEGDQFAFTEIFDRYKDMVYGAAFQLLKSPTSAEEVVQDVFMKVWIKRQEFTSVHNLPAFLFKVTRNLILDRLKRMAYDLAMQRHLSRNRTSSPASDQRTLDLEMQNIIREAIERLPTRQRFVYILAKELGYKSSQIAREMSISKLTVKKHLRLAMQFVRQYVRSRMDLGL